MVKRLEWGWRSWFRVHFRGHWQEASCIGLLLEWQLVSPRAGDPEEGAREWPRWKRQACMEPNLGSDVMIK